MSVNNDLRDPVGAVDAVPLNTPRPGMRRRRFGSGSVTWIFLILIAMVVCFSLLRPDSFTSATNFRNIAVDASILVVLAVGATFVIITAGIDLSVGSVLVFAGVISVKVMALVGGESVAVIALGLLAAVAAGLTWGVLNGALVAYARIPAFIVTLGTFGMSLGLAYVITDGLDLREVPFPLIETLGAGNLFGQVPYLVLVAVVVAIVGAILLAKTRFGRRTYAIGSNAEAVRRAGINVETHLLKIYALAGLLAGLGGFLSLARFGTTTLAGHGADNFQAIAAVVLGGTSLFGGVGTIAGTVVGVFIPVVLGNGFVIVGVQPFWQQVAVGAILILAVFLDQLRRSQYRK